MQRQKQDKKNNKILIPLIMLFLIVITSTLTFSFSVFIMQLIFAFITTLLLIKKDFNIAKIYLVILAVSLFFIFLVYNANLTKYGIPYYIGGSDDLMFEKMGLAVYNSSIFNPVKLMELGIVPSWHNSSFFLVYIALLIGFSNLFDGYSIFLPLIANVYFLLWVTMLLEYFIRKYAKFDDLKIKLSIAIFALTPNIQYINSHIFRDTFNLLQVFLIIYIFDRLLSKKFIQKFYLVVFLVLLIYTTYYTRTTSLVFAGAICLFILAEKLRIKKRYLTITIIPILLVSDFFEIIGLKDYIEGYSDYVYDQAGQGLSSYVFGQSLFPFGIVIRTLYAFITPFPNFFGLFKDSSSVLFDITMLLIYMGVIFQIIAIPFIINRVLKLDWLSLSFLTWFLAIISTTFTFRHVMFYYPFMVAIMVDGYLQTSKRRRKQTLFFSCFFGLSFALIYVSLKFLS
ncbi:hypothetical protein [Aquibacillus sediminis]|uniref:hypothetical protein n=1 Tax=Aquibacillus sediminis TaxID=2574734 RepID=UPI0011096A4F|nr:hypothetical protein [Aquibacillus sediminis]